MTMYFSVTSAEGLLSPRVLDSVLTHQNYSLPKVNMVFLGALSLNKPTCIGFKISLALTVLCCL